MTVKLPEPLIRGTTSSRCISDFMRPREPEYEKMFEGGLQGLEHLGHFYVAPFQRPAVWTDDQKRKLVESVHLGISIGSIVVSAEGKEDKSTGRFPISADLIIDGQQRMRAIKAYREEDCASSLERNTSTRGKSSTGCSAAASKACRWDIFSLTSSTWIHCGKSTTA